jgi:DNA-binding XRE family transcriptional regulator
MMITDEIIQKNGRSYALIPLDFYQRLLEKAQYVDDISLYDDAKKRDEEFFPAALIKSIVDGASPVKVYRTHRGLTQRVLAAGMGISRSYLAEIESGKKRGSVTVLCRAATVLNVDLDMLVTDWESHENKPI